MFSSTGSNHPIIPKQNELILEPHYVTFHSDDRDESKHPSASHWSTRLPQNINSIRSMHLVDAYMPTKHLFVFKNDYQNLAFMIKINKNVTHHNSELNSFLDNCKIDPKCTP